MIWLIMLLMFCAGGCLGFMVGAECGIRDTERRWSEIVGKAKWNWENRGELPGGWSRERGEEHHHGRC